MQALQMSMSKDAVAGAQGGSLESIRWLERMLDMTGPANYCSCHERREGRFLAKWGTPAMTCARADAGVGRPCGRRAPAVW
ncbi:hypothetical protein XAP412_240051 [Xanthomonas phaseoli pv. phaseoli]|uniref:Uncharacterized protein n=1 Tax=Xanthomonas campestris pv. phaseoli TaxID=317013 RepID=A0AB38DXV6_XANCH|nr:hypothetical protein XAP6984_310052 [Xanthomonas phaseoli pv. phaseoli]SON82089.1 hypothetical protein XAP412_240051 [Xanthomonas phaseoli pv. phaseoli]SON86369.1 hypothetical protein XAP7430_260050 [Xanthomonas phaseoli pv. phaseoli]SOO32528.1 hypothetical protein XAP6164_980033 [Xanthomonas phaseoli pv. phaseoli]